MNSNNLPWRLCILAAVLLSLITFTPLVIPEGQIGPKLMGIPYTLWTGFLVAWLLVLVTWIGTRVHPHQDDSNTNS